MKKTKAKNRPKFPDTRKVLRKQKRQEKKIHRKEHYLKKKNKNEQPQHTAGRFVKRPAEDPDSRVEVKKKKPHSQPSAQDVLVRERQKEQKEVSRLNNAMEEQRCKIMLQANEDEDKVIKKLEKQLGLNKSKNKNNFFADDGLDYLLEICDRATSEQIVAAEKHLADVDADSDFEDDLAAVTGKENKDKGKLKQSKDKKEPRSDGKQSKTKKQYKDHDGSSEESDSNDSNNDTRDEDDELMGEDEISDRDSEISDRDSEMKDEDIKDGDSQESDEGRNSDDDAPEEKPTSSQKTDIKSKNKEMQQNPEQHKSKKTEKPKPISGKPEKIVAEHELSNVFSDDEISHLSGDDELSSGDEITENEDVSEVKKNEEKPDVWEDIYGRKRDKEGNVIKEEKGVYVPPHLRNKDSASEKDLTQLKRQIKSVLNKLAGTNLHWACTSIEALYSANSRHSVNSVLTQLWLEACLSKAATPDRLVCEHAALVAVLHANVATEIGAHFLEELTKLFDAMTQTPQPVEDKTLDNVVSCLAHLYNFKIYHANLLYDILTRLLEDLSEKNIDCVLVALRSVGGVLRKEEPVALRDFIHDTQSRVAKMNEGAAAGSRIKFLLEVLMAVKNNNLNKIPNYDPSYGEQLKKMTRTIVRKGNYVTPLNIRLEDLLKAHERGKWWIVGSAWEGARVLPSLEKPAPLPAANEALMRLARHQRMNTDVRRTVFCVVMGADDYMDAFEKLQHLGLRGQQEREIVHVLLACCLNETKYNPYYAVLAQKLCDTHRKYQLSIQFSVWDKIKELEALSKQSVSNLAQFLVHLIIGKGLPLSVLKIIQFSDLNKRSVRFMRQILLAIIMNADFQPSLEVFHRISKAPKLQVFRESLRLFIQHFLIKNAGKTCKVLAPDEMGKLRDRALEVDAVLSLHESKLKL